MTEAQPPTADPAADAAAALSDSSASDDADDEQDLSGSELGRQAYWVRAESNLLRMCIVWLRCSPNRQPIVQYTSRPPCRPPCRKRLTELSWRTLRSTAMRGKSGAHPS